MVLEIESNGFSEVAVDIRENAGRAWVKHASVNDKLNLTVQICCS
jgi:hypothetical protein